MDVKILNEAGYAEALLGLSLSRDQSPERMLDVAVRLCRQDGGHNKFLEAIQVWLDVTAPRYWWQQFDTYRIGVTKQSQSTMHTLLNRPLTAADFAGFIPQATIERLNVLIAAHDGEQAKRELPEAFLQRRIVCLNYKALRNIILQRRNHPLGEWRDFCRQVWDQAAHAYLLPEVGDGSGAD